PNSSSTGSSGFAAAEIATQTRFVISSSLPSDEPSRAGSPSRATHSGNPSGRAGSLRGGSSGAVSGESQISGERRGSTGSAPPSSIAGPTASSSAARVGPSSLPT